LITLLGIIVGFILIIVAMFENGSPSSFINAPSILIVFLGTGAITIVSFSLKDLKNIPKTIWSMISYSPHNAIDIGTTMIQLAEKARQNGIISLEATLKQVKDDPFLHKALTLAVDGTNEHEIENMLQREISYTVNLQNKSVDLLRRAAEVAPAMGLIGTLIGLVQMLGTLEDPSSIGPNMAVALLTTFYGAVMAHMIFLPLAAKAERNSHNQSVTNSLYIVGVLSIAREENPRRLEMQLNAMLPQSQRLQYFK
jgi:chemotaxis protein MotA